MIVVKMLLLDEIWIKFLEKGSVRKIMGSWICVGVVIGGFVL